MRNKHFRIFSFSIGIFFLILSLACKKDTQIERHTDELAARGGDLHVAFSSPKGQTGSPRDSESIVVIFDQPMVPLRKLSQEPGQAVLKIEPHFSGTYRWLTPKTLTFTPDKRFPYATEIQATIPEGTKSLEGFMLRKDFTWSFRTIRPRLVQHFPSNKQKWVKLDSQILLVFNQSVQKNRARKFLSLTGVHNEKIKESLPFDLVIPSPEQLKANSVDSSEEEALLLVPAHKFKPDFTYFVEVHSGFPAKEGPLGMDKNDIFQFDTIQTFAFENFAIGRPHNPYDPLKFKFSNPVLYKNFLQNIRFVPEVAVPDYYSEWTQSSSILWLSLPLEPEKRYSLWISPDLADEFGNSLGKEIKLTFETSPYPRSVTMTTGHRIAEAYGSLKYPVYSVNAEQVLLQAALIPKEELIPLLTKEKIFWSSEKFLRNNFFQTEKVLKLKLTKNKKEVTPINLKDFLQEKYGWIYLQLDTFHPEKWNRYPKAFLQVTELGISAKFSPENNLIWVTELETGQPISNASVEIRDDRNRVCWKGNTDAEGKVETPGWKPLGISSKNEWQKPRQWVFVQRGKDLALTSSDWGTGLEPYQFGIPYDWDPRPVVFSGYVFTERGIYRSGEKVHIKGIVRKREKGNWILPPLTPVICQIDDPFQKTVFKEKIELDDYSSFAFDFDSDADASLGTYGITASIPSSSKDEKDSQISGSFRIEAFKPSEFEIHLRTMKESFTFGEDFKAEARASYLFGGAMAGQKITWHLRLNRTFYTPSGFKDYVFGNQVLSWDTYEEEGSRLLAAGESQLKSDGTFLFKTPLVPEKERDSALAVLEATVQGPSRRSVSNRIQTIVHRGDFYIGLRTSTTFLTKDKELSVDIITVDPEGQVSPERNIELKLLRREWLSVRKEGIGGQFRWMSEKKDTEIDTRKIQTKTTPQQVLFYPKKAGFYLLHAEGRDKNGNTISSTAYFYVTGKDFVSWERKEDDSVELVADQMNYRPGETAKILVKSPYEKAKALVTIERELVLETHVSDIQGNADTVEIPILSSHIPNIFVSVLLVKGRTSEEKAGHFQDIGKPSFKIGYVYLGVDPSEKRLNIDIQKVNKSYKPGDKVAVELNVKDWKGVPTEASLSLAVVDMGVLNLIGYQTPDVFSRFYGQKPLSVQTSETRQHVIGERVFGEKGDAVGGGAGELLSASFAPSLPEVKLRGDFKFTAFWDASLQTDKSGKAIVEFVLPDNLTTFRIMVVAQTKDSRFGRAEKTFKVSKQLLLQPALPRFARVGDEFQGGVVIHSFLSKKGKVMLSCESKGLKMIESNPVRQFFLSPGEGKEILFSFRVDKPGNAVLSFKAQMGDASDGLEITIPLKMPRLTETVALFGSSENSAEEKIQIPEEAYLEESLIEFRCAASALSGLAGSVNFLTDYPYFCLEQRLSAALPFLVAKDVILDFHLSKFTNSSMDEHIRRTLKEVLACQKENGGFGPWPDSPMDSPFLSCYAAMALAKAQEAGFSVDKESIEKVSSYLEILLARRYEKTQIFYTKRTWKTVHAFALYSLALLGHPEPSYAENLFKARDELSLFARTLLLKAIHITGGPRQAQTALAEELINKIKVSPTQIHFEDDEGQNCGWIYSSSLRTTALILQSLLEADFNPPIMPEIARWLIARRKAGKWSTTQENFFVFYALNEFYKKYENVAPDFKVKVLLAKKILLEDAFNPEQKSKMAEGKTSLAAFDPGKTVALKINKKGKGPLYYETRMTYAPRKKLDPRDQGFAIVKEITSLDGRKLDSIEAGSLVLVTLKVILPMESLYVVVDDPLPAGLEAVNPTYLTESEEQERKLEEIRAKDNQAWWWEGFNHIELRDDRVLLFADSLAPGIHTHRYLARALIHGIFHAPGTKAEEMYTPEVFGRSSELVVKITR